MKHSGFMDKIKAECDWECMVTRVKTTFITRQQTIDIMLLSLGEMGFTREQYIELRKKYKENELEYCGLVIEDSNAEDSKSIEGTELQKSLRLAESRDKLDRALKSVIPEELFSPYKQRYDMTKVARRYGFDPNE